MKKFIFCGCVFFSHLVNTSAQASIQFQAISFEKALSIAKKEKSIVFVDTYTEWCKPCHWMDAEVFTDPRVAGFFNARFINLRLDMEDSKGIQFANKYNVKLYPTLFFLNYDGQVLHKAFGARDSEQLIQLGLTALDPQKRLSYFTESWERKKSDPEFLRNYAGLLDVIGSSETETMVMNYLSTQKNWLQKENMALIYEYAKSDVHSELWNHILHNMGAYYELFDEKDIDDLLLSGFDNGLEENENNFEELLHLFSLFPKGKNQKYAIQFRLKKYLIEGTQLTKQQEFLDLASAYQRDFNNPGWALANNLAWRIQEVSEKKTDLVIAKKFAESSVKENPHYHNMDTLAQILFKLGDLDEAKKIADQAIGLAVQEGLNPSSTIILIDKIQKNAVKTQGKN